MTHRKRSSGSFSFLLPSLLELPKALMLFFYNVRYVGRLFVKGSGKPVEILPKLNEMAGFSADEEIELYEVSLTFSFFLI